MRIVLADDAAPLRAAFTRYARGLGHEVVGIAVDGEAALSITAEAAPDAVVVDSRLPIEGALPVVAALRAAYPAVAVYVIASLEETALVRAAVAAGAAGAILRPVVMGGVAAALREK